MYNVNIFEICIKVLFLHFKRNGWLLLLCCIGYTNMDDYNGNHENSFMELLMEGDYRRHCNDGDDLNDGNYNDGGDLDDGNCNDGDNNDDGDDSDNDDDSDSDSDDNDSNNDSDEEFY